MGFGIRSDCRTRVFSFSHWGPQLGLQRSFRPVNTYSIAYLGLRIISAMVRHHRLDLISISPMLGFSSRSFPLLSRRLFSAVCCSTDSFKSMVSIGGLFWLELFGLHFTFFQTHIQMNRILYFYGVYPSEFSSVCRWVIFLAGLLCV